MNWWRHPELLDRLAGEYALGTLHGGARRRFEAVMGAHPVVARAVARWAQDLQPLDAVLQPLPADDVLWQRIEGRLFGGAVPAQRAAVSGSAASNASSPVPRAEPQVEPWWKRWFGPRPAAALAFGLMAGVAIPTLAPLLQSPSGDETQLPESYVGVLATADGKPGLIISSLRRGRTLDLKQVKALPLPPGRQWVLWVLDAQGGRQAVATLPALNRSFTSVPLPADSETLFSRAVELAISAEPAGTALTALTAPTEPYAWRGLCGKLWRLPAAAPGAPATPPPASNAASSSGMR